MSAEMKVLIAVTGVLAVGGLALWWLVRDSMVVHRRLSEIEVWASNAESMEELEDAQAALQVYHARNSWHGSHDSHAREVLEYIRGRMEKV